MSEPKLLDRIECTALPPCNYNNLILYVQNNLYILYNLKKKKKIPKKSPTHFPTYFPTYRYKLTPRLTELLFLLPYIEDS